MSDYRTCDVCGVYEFDDFHKCLPPPNFDEATLYKIRAAVLAWQQGNFDHHDVNRFFEDLSVRMSE